MTRRQSEPKTRSQARPERETPLEPFQAYFGRPCVINLDSDILRLEHVSARLGRQRILFERFPACRADEVQNLANPVVTAGQIACALSHKAVLERALARGDTRILILEDDVVMRDDAGVWLQRIVPQLRAVAWDICFLGLHLLKDGGQLTSNLGRVGRSFHSHAYAATRHAMPRMIEFIDRALREHFHFDCYNVPDLFRVYVNPILAIQAVGQSQTTGDSTNRLCEYFPPFNGADFLAHCAEARSWGAALWKEVSTTLPSGGSLTASSPLGPPEPLPVNSTPTEAHRHLGRSLAARGDHRQAAIHLAIAARHAPEDADSYHELAESLRQSGDVEGAIAAGRQAICLRPDHVEALNNLALLLVDDGRPAEAIPLLERAIAKQPACANAHWNLSLALLTLGDFENGWREYEWRKNLPADTPYQRSFSQPPWSGESLAGKTILLLCEQGIGDVVQFVRYASLIADTGARVLLECPPNLCPALKSVRGIHQIIARGDALPDFDTHARLMSLPALFRTNVCTVPSNTPYLFTDPARVEFWGKTFAPIREFKVGIAWHGSDAYRLNKTRSIPLHHYKIIADCSEVKLVSLQKGPGAAQLHAGGSHFPALEFNPPLDASGVAFVDTAAVMCALDLIITSDTSVAHVAGALGLPVWVALPYAADWRWLTDRDDSPWYPTMRLFRQRIRGDWPEVFVRMAQALRDMAR